ncbi:cytochrome P450 [Pseudomonas sp. MYb541]|uniref:cytochrome P450 n=1 Tax=Pseudomonas TaxID=286 RepID=UPI000F0476E8
MTLQSIPDLSAPEIIADPYPAFTRLREHHPVHWDKHYKAWLLSRYDDVSVAQADARRFSSERMRALVNAQVPPKKRKALEPFIEKASRWMYALDGKTHEDGRRVLGRAFTPQTIEALRTDIERIVDDLLEGLDPKPELMEQLFNQIPARILANLYGIPAEDALKLRQWTDAMIFFMVGSPDPNYGPEQALLGMEEMYAYFSSLIDAHRRQPRDDLVSRVIAAGDASGMSKDDYLAQLAFVLLAGNTTSADQLGITLFYLLSHPDQLAALKSDPTLIKGAIEEGLRICPAGQLSHRVLTADVELHGQVMRKGCLVYLLRAAANRDPKIFKEPDRYDIRRIKHDHLAFGRGPHFCMGSMLFKLEAEILLTRLLQRFPDISLDKHQPPVWRRNSLQFRGLSQFPVILETDDTIKRCFSAAPWEQKAGYCRALRVGQVIITSGTVAFGKDGNPCAIGDAYQQTLRCLNIIEDALKQMGTDRTRVIATRMYTTNMKLWPKIAQAHGEFFKGCPPTTMLLGVNALIAKEYLVEIEAQAVAVTS